MRGLWLLVLVVVGSCGGGVPSGFVAARQFPNTTALRTDFPHYFAAPVDTSHVQFGFRVVARYTNSTSAAIYLGRCTPQSPHPIYGVILVSTARTNVSAYSPVWACVGHDQQILVKPGETRIDTLQIRGPNTFSGTTHQGFGALEGTFRLQYGPQKCPGDGKCPIDTDALRYSNEFTVTLQR